MGQKQAKLFGQVELYWKEISEMNGLFGEFILSIVVYLADKLSGH